MKFTVEAIEGGRLPERKHETDSCWDLYARVTVVIEAGESCLVPCGFKLALKKGWEAQIRPRSGMARDNRRAHFGTVDAGYRGEVCAIIHNDSRFQFVATAGERIAQMAIKRVPVVTLVPGIVDKDTDRGSNGFGSTGKN